MPEFTITAQHRKVVLALNYSIVISNSPDFVLPDLVGWCHLVIIAINEILTLRVQSIAPWFPR